MGNGTSRVAGCFVPFNGKTRVDLDLEPLDEGLGHSFCYVRPSIFDSPAITPSNSERFTVDSSTLDSETLSGSFRNDTIEEPLGLQRMNKSFLETTFRTISGASVSANVSTARTGNQSAMFAIDVQEPAASFESTSSFAAIPLQLVPRGSGPLNGFMSGPLERGFASGPLDKVVGFMSGPIEKGMMSGPLDATDKSNFSAPLTRSRIRPRFQRLMRSASGQMRRTFLKHSMGSGWMHRLFLHPVTEMAWHAKETKFRSEPSRNCFEGGLSEGEYGNSRNLQWAHGKAGEDRVHVVLSEEQGWLFIGIYDGFSGPDAPDFVMRYLYKAIDKELEGLLWDYDEPGIDLLKPEISESKNHDTGLECSNEDQAISCSDQEVSSSVGKPLNGENDKGQSSNIEITVENDDVRGSNERNVFNCRKSSLGVESEFVQHANLAGQGRKSMRLYELLQMESWDGQGSLSTSQMDRQGKVSSDCCHQLSDNVECISSSNYKDDAYIIQCEDPTTSGEDTGVGLDFDNQSAATAASMSGQRQSTRKSLIGSKIRKIYQKQKSLRKKLFPWRHDWHRDEICVDERIVESSRPIRRCKSGVVDHDAVLRALARALESTEEAYMEMVQKALDINPELALMGSCVLVMLMKDQDVYVMNLGDSRVILAQERPNDRHPNPALLKDDLKYRNRSRESLLCMELDIISEESPMHRQHGLVSMINKNRDISICQLKMKAIQLSSDHSTSIEEEILRIKAEHPDDDKAVSNDRVKGQLKVTRAFGAGFLKKLVMKLY
ncbi:protein phosphatase 2C 32-like isoform X2 [Hibiscus syriacus]|uniref:protein phosphatase 2C 32-like isoform X2 n=1 Tax=Hibiscus syriacus TaxID=106335 RepID=UPI00192502C1|nr:protein phosphatase 2C 32-like isoform X2 [Hibiscus syriacus]